MPEDQTQQQTIWRTPRPASRRIADDSVANACYFRSRARPGHRKALLKVTDRCNLRCSHCFVSATTEGADMNPDEVAEACGALVTARVANVTITGGEPLVHPELAEIMGHLVTAGLDVTVCTNGVGLTDELVGQALGMGRVSFNVSLDGSTAESHGRFRGNVGSFEITASSVRRLAQAGLLKGILSTPNALAGEQEYDALFDLTKELGAEYLLMNPLSSFGRGIRNRRLRAEEEAMERIQIRIGQRATSADPEPVFIRFPNSFLPLTNCMAGEVLYVFVNGDVTVCPYLVFATENPGAQHSRDEFIVGNLFTDANIADLLDAYDFHSRYRVGANTTCSSCSHGDGCGKGCPAAVIAGGGRIGDLDVEVCPVAPKAPIANLPQNSTTTDLAWNPVKVALTQKPGHAVIEHTLDEAPIS